MKRKSTFMNGAKIAVVAAALVLSGCETMNKINEWIDEHPDEVRMAALGLVGGGIAGAHLGGGATAIAAGAVVGTAIGWQFGAFIRPEDEGRFDRAVQRAAGGPGTETIQWQGSASGTTGTITPIGEISKTPDGRTCRVMEATLNTPKGRQTGRRTLCRGDDGSWVVAG